MKSTLWAGAVVFVVAQAAQAQQAVVTGVQLAVRDGELVLTLEIPGGTPVETFSADSDRVLIVNIPNVRLQLPTGEEEFRQSNPSPGVESVTVAPLEDGSGIQITAIGTAAAPTSEIQVAPQGLVVNLRSPQTATDEAPTTVADEPETIDVIVTATRREEDVRDVPRAVTVITREEFEQQTAVADDFSDVLPRLVPGLGPPNQLGGTFGQNLRGRPPLILIDGIPQNSNTNFSTELNAIDPSIVERVEVVRGPSATFGDGATGGVINIITRRPAEGEGLVSQVSVGTLNFPTNFGDSFSFDVQYSLSGRSGPYDFVLDGTFDLDQSRFDGEGNQLPPNELTSDDRSLNFLGKFGVDLTENQRLQFSYNIFNDRFDSEFISDPEAVAPEGLQTAVALDIGEIDFDETPEQTVQNLSLQYRHADLFGSELEAFFYFRDTNLTQTISDVTDLIPPGTFPGLPSTLFQTSLDASEIGARLQLNTPVTNSLEIFYGVDFSLEETKAPFLFLDPIAFAENNEASVIETLDQFPDLSQRNIGAFVQLRWEITDELLFNGGVRYEAIQVDVEDFLTTPFAEPLGFPSPIEGATLNTDDVVFNAGIVYRPIEVFSIFANFSQGFNVPEFGAFLSFVDADFLVENLDFIAQRVDNFELGFQIDLGRFRFSIAGFFNESEEGLSFFADPVTGVGQPTIAPQRNLGFEATIDWQFTDLWSFDAAITFNEGEFDIDNTGDFVPLATIEVPPFTFVMGIENQTLPRWRNRLQLLLVADREDAFEAGTDPVPIEGYTTVDFISSLEIGSGRLVLGISNLFDTDFIPAALQDNIGLLETERFGGLGRSIALKYSVTF